MAEINKKQDELFDYATVEALYRKGTSTPLMGTEIEAWIVHKPQGPGLPAEMMTPADSQAILSKIAQADDAILFSETNGVRQAGKFEGAPLVYVETNKVSFQLELSGVLEAATAPFPVTEVNQLLQTTREGQQVMRQVARSQGLTLYPLAILGSARIEDCERNMVNRERLRAEWEKFKLYGKDSPGLRTMGLAASVQVSLGYRDDAELRDIMRLSYMLSPVLTAAFANTSGFVEDQRRDELARPRWWLEHNNFAPRAGIPPFMLDVIFGKKDTDIVKGWLDHAMSTPMVYSYDENGNAVFDTSPTFKGLFSEGLGTMSNFYLAESLLWPDVKLIGGKRIELRMCDSGPWQAEALTVMVATLLADPEGRKKLELLMDSLNIRESDFVQARTDVNLQGLDTKFGNTDLRALLPRILELSLEIAQTNNIEDRFLGSLRALKTNPVSDFEKWRDASFADAAMADAYICDHADALFGNATLSIKPGAKHGL